MEECGPSQDAARDSPGPDSGEKGDEECLRRQSRRNTDQSRVSTAFPGPYRVETDE